MAAKIVPMCETLRVVNVNRAEDAVDNVSRDIYIYIYMYIRNTNSNTNNHTTTTTTTTNNNNDNATQACQSPREGEDSQEHVTGYVTKHLYRCTRMDSHVYWGTTQTTATPTPTPKVH